MISSGRRINPATKDYLVKAALASGPARALLLRPGDAASFSGRSSLDWRDPSDSGSPKWQMYTTLRPEGA